jgi:riboflavin kinase/FMN adenylyltransferase
METKNFSSGLKLADIKEIAIGKFDGMHLAHDHLLSRLSGLSAVVVIDSNKPILLTRDRRFELIKKAVIVLKLEDIRELDGKEFLELLKINIPNIEKIVVGYDFRFGHKRRYNTDDLVSLFDGNVEVVDEFCIDGISVHAEVIKQFLRDGDLIVANRLLGRYYNIIGASISGQGIGKEKLFATINIEAKTLVLLSEGIYASFTVIDDVMFDSVSFIGHRESTDNVYAIETHIIDKVVDIENDQKIEVLFVEKIRDNRKFDVLEELKMQIQKDIDSSKGILGLLD